ncbi:hypothetical protein [Paraliomyxa miuraensis]|uniref:hypothetical protein n=1 Tax=Paraliomyxa miuraensis TaxID=376150 RepID=UPI0022514D39|nr:hypothetical protein [Paraliomyxa miuraensis]MCX4243546.1 hypothetical protein [Paraliomyxa miuraensis]
MVALLPSLAFVLVLGPSVGAAQPASPPPATAPAQPVDDAAWEAVQGRQIVIDTHSGAVGGELLRSDGKTLVLLQADGRVLTLAKTDALAVRVVQESGTGAAPAPAPAPAPASAPAPAVAPAPAPSPAPAATPATTNPAPAPAAPAPAATPATDPATTAPATTDSTTTAEPELTPAQQRRKERREKREHAILGAFTMQGATYTHWRDKGDTGVNAGHASYAMDFGLGANLSPGFGMYAVAGGLLGAKIDDATIKANYGHLAVLFAFGGKYYYSTVGAGVAFSRLRFPDDTLAKDKGLSLPMKLVGKIPLPKKLYLGLGLTYELGMVAGFSRFINGIGGQIVFGRW